MRSTPEQLANTLQKRGHRSYLVTGEETLLVQECCDLIRQKARADGCSEREILDVTPKGFNWNEIHDSAASMSLFSDRKLIELRLPTGKPGADGSKAICAYLEDEGCEDILLIVAGKIDKASTNSKWFKALDKAGLIVQVWPIDATKLQNWLNQRVQRADMTISPEALQLLSDRVEGNLLSAVQEIEKLKLLADNNHIDADTVLSSVADNARYNLFSMIDCAIAGRCADSLKMLYGLRGEGTVAAVPSSMLLRELRKLYALKVAISNGENSQQSMRNQGIWDSKTAMFSAALGRHSLSTLEHALQQAVKVDGSIKGFADGNPWDNLAKLIVDIGAPERAA